MHGNAATEMSVETYDVPFVLFDEGSVLEKGRSFRFGRGKL